MQCKIKALDDIELFFQNNFLSELKNNDIMSTDVLELVNKMKQTKVNSVHPYQITMPNVKGEYFQTYVKNEDGTRRKIKAKTEQALNQKLYQFYFEDQVYTMKSLYLEWETLRKSQNISSATTRRNYFHYKKYYFDDPLSEKPLNKITYREIEDFYHKHIKAGMTSKELQNVKLILAEIMKMAKSKDYISYNPFKDAEIKTFGCIPPKNTRESSKVYLEHEKELLFKGLNQHLMEFPHSTDALGVFLLFKLGLRLGELVALKETDIDFINREIHIQRTETMRVDDNGKTEIFVVEHTKKKSIYGDRWLPLDVYSLELLKRIINTNKAYNYTDQNYLFLDCQGRTTEREIDYLIRKICKNSGMEIKSAHDIRRTVASEMHYNGVPLEIIKKFLGHSDLATTRSYIFDINTKEERNQIIIDALSSMNGLKQDSKGLKKIKTEKNSKVS